MIQKQKAPRVTSLKYVELIGASTLQRRTAKDPGKVDFHHYLLLSPDSKH